MNYLFVLHTINCGGAEKYIINLANALAEQNSEDGVWLYVFDDSTFYYELISPSVNFIQNNHKQDKPFSIKWYFNFYLLFGIKLAWQTRKINYNYVISGYEELSEIAVLFIKLLKVFRNRNTKYVSFIHNTFRYFELRGKTSLYVFKNKILDFLRINYLDIFFVVSKQIKTEFLEKYSNKICKILSPILNSVNISTNNNEKIEQLEQPYVISVGRINQTKNQKLLINAFGLIKNKNVKLFVFGNIEDPIYYQEIKNKIHEIGLSERIFINELAVKNIEFYISQATALLVTSKNEGFPLNIVEAMNYSVPVISTPFPGSDYLEGKGFLLKSFNEEEFAKTLDALLDNKIFYDSQMKQNVEKFLLRFQGHIIAKQFSEELI